MMTLDRPSESVAPPTRIRHDMRALIVDDDRTLREGCAAVMRAEGVTVEVTDNGEDAINRIHRTQYDMMLVDVHMTPVTGVDVLKAVMATSPRTLVVLMTGQPSVCQSMEAIEIGAFDYLSKPYSGTQLQLLLGRAALVMATRRQQDGCPGATSLEDDGQRLMHFGKAPALLRAAELAKRAAGTSAAVMIVGETGTGKEIIANYIHQNSRRAKKPLVAVNCAAIPENLLESEMFGHRKGAFTGADRCKKGLLEMANGGTLFLDELTEMSMSLQAKLLRVVQDGVVRPVGSEDSGLHVDVRFISASNRDPQDAIRANKLREDLYYRLNVVQIVVPPLRERTEDIPALANHFLRYFWTRHRSPREPLPTWSEDTLEFLATRPWRGNVRELQNFVEYVTVIAQPGSKILVHQLPIDQQIDSFPEPAPLPALGKSDAYHVAKDEVLANFEKAYVKRLVARASGNMSRAARLASVDRTTLYRLLERHGFQRELEPGTEPRPRRATPAKGVSRVADPGSSDGHPPRHDGSDPTPKDSGDESAG